MKTDLSILFKAIWSKQVGKTDLPRSSDTVKTKYYIRDKSVFLPNYYIKKYFKKFNNLLIIMKTEDNR